MYSTQDASTLRTRRLNGLYNVRTAPSTPGTNAQTISDWQQQQALHQLQQFTPSSLHPGSPYQGGDNHYPYYSQGTGPPPSDHSRIGSPVMRQSRDGAAPTRSTHGSWQPPVEIGVMTDPPVEMDSSPVPSPQGRLQQLRHRLGRHGLFPKQIIPSAVDANPGSNLVCIFTHMPDFKDIVVAALPEIMNILKMASVSEMAFEHNIPTRYHNNTWFTSSFRNDARILARASELHDALVAELQAFIPDGDFITQCLF
ncbi:hypothetical protein B0T26DRAFT_680604 [Lasiosphaeria miniovina]|uniref:Uncharacterized protein n=1 Tax=Lasiosphaeria miniovina TaxID=1954250 RepID=A0AA40A0I1_9PEZI|nr:uncharacterized protein B0T26DRAFT_680604 [Lasiosphaeria miniovina]KAK0707022.1 hypothetical protein B0T26DRAFT_680604 [Lasiosphaeria miniovina]